MDVKMRDMKNEQTGVDVRGSYVGDPIFILNYCKLVERLIEKKGKLGRNCIWKILAEDPDSTSGQDMRRAALDGKSMSSKKARRCVECDGSEAYALSRGQSCYTEMPELRRENDR